MKQMKILLYVLFLVSLVPCVLASAPAEDIVLTGDAGRVRITRQGARILSWCDGKGREILFMPRQPVTAGG